eukprot:CAMPEP_0118797644 /NCGR_PEP_ID=MMETSP1161-20130426/160_1 /TAXON_ID=249345 /ORGANISM="Picochlorum oklahomensis, Strain CCMP2329" /LENGTH=99 /DNA_ID=CAMNT_0006724851 /DNA_START=67 /DNA_END=366 /DNA_ORIENTATION=+
MSVRPAMLAQRLCAAKAVTTRAAPMPMVSSRVSLATKKNNVSARQTVVANMGATEVAQVAGEAGYIGGVAGVMFGITLVGLAIGFVLLRIESLAEEGKI